MKLHEIQCHFHEVPHAVTEYRLRRRPHKILIHEDEHEDETKRIRLDRIHTPPLGRDDAFI